MKSNRPPPHNQQPPSGDTDYPHLEAWVYEQGWIEIGSDMYSSSFIRILDSGGLVWEGADTYPSLDAAMRAADAALAELEADGALQGG